MKKTVVAICLVMTAVVSWARTESVTLWRGEMRTFIMHDFAKIGCAPKGFEVKVGTAKEIRYLERPLGTRYQSMADRVVWGSPDSGVKILSVMVPADAKPGTYFAGDVKITVVDRVLPPATEWKYRLDLWQHPWAVARHAGVEPFSPAHYAAMEPLWRLLADAGQKSLTVTLLDRPWNHQCYDAYRSMIRHIRHANGSWTFDYGVFDEYIAFGRRCGLGPDIKCFTLCPWDYEVSWEDDSGARKSALAIPGSPEFEMYWGDFLVDFTAHLKSKGWFQDAWMCMDERSPADVKNIVRFVNRKAPGLRIFLAGNRAPSEFAGVTIDDICCGIWCLSEALSSEASARRAQGMRTTYYVCCGPKRPNTMCHNEIEESFWLGAYPAMVGLDGFVRWAWNSWPEDPMHDASYTGTGGGWGAGDTYLVYPDGSPSLRFLELRNGIVAAEKVRILREQGLFTKELDALAALYDRKAASAGKVDFFELRNKTQELVNRVGCR